MRPIMLRMIAMFGLVAMLLSGSAFAGNELIMQKVANDAPIVLASGSHNPCSHHDNDGEKANNACNPCGHNPCAANACNPCGHHDNDGEKASNACNPCAKH